MQQILYLVQKEFRQIFRDRFMVGFLFIVPIIQIFVLGNAVTTNVVNVKVVMHDADRTPMSRDLTGRFTHSRYFRVVAVEDDYTALTRALDRGDASLALVIPRHFQRDAVNREKPAVQLLVDALDGNSSGIALGYVSEIVQRYQADAVLRDPALAAPMAGTHRAEIEPRYWYNPELESKVYIIPGIMAILLVIVTIFLTSMGIVREKEIGTLEQLMVTPIRSYQLIVGKIIPFAVLGFLEMILVMGFVYLIFGIGITGSIPLLFAEAMLFIFTTLGLGILISTIAETQQQALFIGWFFMIFAMLLSGFFIPIANMPPSIQAITYANPVRYFLIVLREIYLKGTGLSDLIPETLSMAAISVTVFTAAVLRFRSTLR